ncbi:MAG: polyprenyl synthetase family protein [Planctomycetota bacterium]|jgi:octaprenyl-diphosphate synthase
MQLPAHTDISDSLPWSGIAAFGLITEELGRVKQLIDEQLTGCAGAPELHRLLASFNSSSGKMLRPGLVLLAGASVGKITNEHINVAAIVEMIHNATLLHDDVIDEGRQRRGAPTVNSLWGNESAVLLGDFLLSKAFRMCADLQPKITRIIASTAVRTCEGELRQTIQKHNWRLTEAEYIDIITEKSAALFRSSCELGAVLAGAHETQAGSLAEFGLNMGIAFQITDDLLDIVGDEGKTGKTLGSDVDKDKLTLAVIHLLRTVDENERNVVKDRLNAPGRDKKTMVKMLSRFGSLKYAHSFAEKFINKALQSLADLKESKAKQALLNIADFVADRAG